MFPRVISGLTYVVPVAVIVSVWFPLLKHYYVPAANISTELLQSAKQSPNDVLLEEISRFTYGQPRSIDYSKEKLVIIANDLLRGQIELPGRPPKPVHIPFDPSDFAIGPSDWQLEFSSLIVPSILLRAYEQTQEIKFFDAARDFILSWAAYESSAWLPKGHLWNDHALAARVVILTDFWRHYRKSSSYDPDKARMFLGLIVQTAQRLSKSGLYTFSTNHGVMQNLALLHLRLAFPMLPGFDGYGDLAFERLNEQLGFYINDEGVVLEHSPGYQELGLELLGTALRYTTLLGRPISKEMKNKYERVRSVYAMFRRPDGSLPRIGDTTGRFDPKGPVVTDISDHGASRLHRSAAWKPPSRDGLYPAAGYAVWWDGLEHWPRANRLSQTVLAWSHYPSDSHKHPDELSMVLWAGGDWWTGVGDWPYSVPGRRQAISWQGSNAPHLVGEAFGSARTLELRQIGWSNKLAFVELERQGPGGFGVRRQVIHLKPNVWAIIDSSTDDQARHVRMVWTSSQDVTYEQGSTPGSYRLTRSAGNSRATIYFLGSNDAKPEVVVGGSSFLGWVEWSEKVMPAPAFVLEYPSQNSWSANVTVFEAEHGLNLKVSPKMQHWKNAEHWELSFSLKDRDLTIRREGAVIDGAGLRTRLVLRQAPDATAGMAAARYAYATAFEKYGGVFFNMLRDRQRATYLLLGILVLQQIVLFFLQKRFPVYSRTLKVLVIPVWIIFGTWLWQVYFRSYSPLWDKLMFFSG